MASSKIENVRLAIDQIDAKAKKLAYRRDILMEQLNALEDGECGSNHLRDSEPLMTTERESGSYALTRTRVKLVALKLATESRKPKSREVWERVLRLILDIKESGASIDSGNKFCEYVSDSLKEELGAQGISQQVVAATWERFQ